MPVWDFSTPSMGLQELGLPDLYEPEHNEVQDALCVFNMPTMPTLLDTSGPVADAEAFQKATARHRARRSLSMEQKQVSNREHQRRFRERSKVIETPQAHLRTGQDWLLTVLFGCTATKCRHGRSQGFHQHKVLKLLCKVILCIPSSSALSSQARSQAIEAQLATTAKELQELKSRHHQLEVLLEQAHQSSQNQLFPPTSDAEV